MRTLTDVVRSIVNEETRLDLDICTPDGTCVGSLRPLTLSSLDDAELIARMTDWRNRMRSSFLTQASVTVDTTRAFISDALLRDSTRMLFIMRSGTQPVGTIGLKLAPPWVHGAGPSDHEQQGRRLAELANLLRGSREGHTMLMYYGEMALMEWGFRELNIDVFWTAVPSDNRLALSLHRSAGFRATELIPLFRTEVNGAVHLVPGDVGQISPDGRYAQRIELGREEFLLKKEELVGICSYGVPRRPAEAGVQQRVSLSAA